MLEFYLHHQGPLKINSSSKEKHQLRRLFQIQLKNVWSYLNKNNLSTNGCFDLTAQKTIETFTFQPMVACNSPYHVNLDFQFLTHKTSPGYINGVGNHGDVDNMAKHMMDALRIPKLAELGNSRVQENETPFCTLVEDDRIVRELTVKHNKLFFSLDNKTEILGMNLPYQHVFATIKVTIRPNNAVL